MVEGSPARRNKSGEMRVAKGIHMPLDEQEALRLVSKMHKKSESDILTEGFGFYKDRLRKEDPEAMEAVDRAVQLIVKAITSSD